MKKSIVFMVIMMTSTIIFAQRNHRDGNTGDGRAERFKKELSLSDEQTSKVKAIRTKYSDRYHRIRKDTAMTQGMARNEQKKLRTEQDAELKGVLSPEQWTKYTAMKAKAAEHRKKYHHHGTTQHG